MHDAVLIEERAAQHDEALLDQLSMKAAWLVRRCMLVPYAFERISAWLQRLDRFAQVVERTKGAR